MYVMYSRNNKRATRLVFEHKQFFQVSSVYCQLFLLHSITTKGESPLDSRANARLSRVQFFQILK